MSSLTFIKGENFSGRSDFLKTITIHNEKNVKKIYIGPPQTNYFSGMSESVKFEFIIHNLEKLNNDIDSIIDHFSLEHLYHSNPFTLSGGEQVLICILTSFLLNPKVFSIDIITEQLSKLWKSKLFLYLNKLYSTKIHVVDNRMEESNFDFKYKEIDIKEKNIEKNKKNISIRISKINDNEVYFGKKDYGNLTVKNLTFKYKARSENILKNIDLNLEPGKIYHLSGANGAGKTTLAKILSGVLKIHGKNIISYRNGYIIPYRNPGHHVGYCFQNPDEQLFSSSVANEVNYNKRKVINRKHLDFFISAFGIKNILRDNPFDFPYVIRRIISLVATLSIERPWYIFDEPIYGLDNNNVHSLASIFKYMLRNGKGIIIITHNDILFDDFPNISRIHIKDGIIEH